MKRLMMVFIGIAMMMPFGAIWDYYCTQQNVLVGMDFLDEIRAYERQVLSERG